MHPLDGECQENSQSNFTNRGQTSVLTTLFTPKTSQCIHNTIPYVPVALICAALIENDVFPTPFVTVQSYMNSARDAIPCSFAAGSINTPLAHMNSCLIFFPRGNVSDVVFSQHSLSFTNRKV